MDKAYEKLQNGSDIRGTALENEAGEAVDLTPAAVQNIASAFVDYIKEKKGISYDEIRIGVGHDSRLSAGALKQGVISGILQRGSHPYDCGLASTPAMFMSTVFPAFAYSGAVMITASHLPYQRNGLKFFTCEGGLESDEIHKILERASLLARMGRRIEIQQVERADLMAAYSRHLQEVIKREAAAANYDRPLEGLHIVVDASNGVSGYFAGLLEELGASVKGSICLEPDGRFPNHAPNPENPRAMNALQKAVLKAKADLGIIFDTDGDRCAVVLSDGAEVNRNAIIALMAAILADKYPNATIVTDSVTSSHLTDFLEKELHMKHHRFKRGYKNVINEAIRLNELGQETPLAIETSGHGALKENYFLDDGAYMSVKIISRLAVSRREGKALGDLIKNLEKPAQSREYRLKIQAEDYRAYGARVLDTFRKFVEKEAGFYPAKENYEGVRADYSDGNVKGWLLLRMSLHEPVMPLNMEAEQDGGVDILWERIRPFLEKQKELSGIEGQENE